MYVTSQRLRASVAVASLLLAAGPAVSQTVGKTAAVNPASTGSGRVLTLGAEIVHKERIQTGASGSLQLLFIDRTSMNIGPNSDLVIDEYVFDPRTNTGKMSVSLGKGLMRFVGGQISHEGNATVNTPSAVIGIRGATGSFTYDPGTKLTTASNDCKDCTITVRTPNGQSVSIPGGFTATVSKDGGVTVAPTPKENADKSTQQTQSKGDQKGGADDQTSKDVSTAETNSPLTNPDPNSSSNTQTTQNQSPPPPPPPPLLPPPPPPPPPPSFSALPFAMSMTTCCGDTTANSPSTAPFLPKSFADPSSNTLISPVLAYRTASTATPAPARFLQYGIDISGNAANQTSWFFVATGAFLDDGQGGLVQQGGFTATRRGAANLPMGRASGNLSSPAGAVHTDSNLVPTSATINQLFYNTDTGVYDQPGNQDHRTDFFLGGGGPGSSTDYTYTQTEQRITTPSGLASDRPTQTTAAGNPLTGYVAGIMRSNPASGSSASFIVANTNNSTSDVVVQLDPSSSRMQANFNVKNINSNISATTLSFAHYQFGSLDPADRARSTYLDYDTFAARDGRVGPSGNTDPTSTVNGLAVDNTHGALLNVRRSDAQQIVNGIDPNNTSTAICQCDYTKWGFWSMDDSRTVSGNSISDRGHMMLWVAGRRPLSASDVPTTGTATYAGHVVVNVRNGTNEYLSGSAFTNTVNFGASSNQMTVNVATPTSTLDGASYSGSLSLRADRRDFGGTLQGTGNGLTGNLTRTMTMNGSFFQGVSSPISEMAGNVVISNTATGSAGYTAAGIFAGRKQ
jgi:hypothetical protein